MNDHHTGAEAGNSANAAHTRAVLQQAVDHYPRLAAFSFTLVWPYRETMTYYRSLILRFHTDVWQRISEYSWERQQARRNSPPTLLRWMWESVSATECRMALLMNLDTLGAGRHSPLFEHILPVMNEMLSGSWLTVTGAASGGIMNITPIIINRSGRGTFTTPFYQLKAHVQAMEAPVVTARTSVTGYELTYAGAKATSEIRISVPDD